MRKHKKHRLWLLTALFFATLTSHTLSLVNCAFATDKNGGVQLQPPPGTPEPVDAAKGQRDRTSTDTTSSPVVNEYEYEQTGSPQSAQGFSRFPASLATEVIVPADGFTPLLEGENLPQTITIRVHTRGRGHSPIHASPEPGSAFITQPRLMNTLPLPPNRQSSPIRYENPSPQIRLNLSIEDMRRFILVLLFPDVIRRLETEISKGVSIPEALQQHAQLPVHQTATIIELLSYLQPQFTSKTQHIGLQELPLIINKILTVTSLPELQKLNERMRSSFSKVIIPVPVHIEVQHERTGNAQQMEEERRKLHAIFFRHLNDSQNYIWPFTEENMDRARTRQETTKKLLEKIDKYISKHPDIKTQTAISAAYKNNVIYTSNGDGTPLSRQWPLEENMPAASEIEEYRLQGDSHIHLPLLPTPLILPAMKIIVTTAYKQCFSPDASFLFHSFDLAKFLSRIVLVQPFSRNNEETALVMVKVLPLLAGKPPPIASGYCAFDYIDDPATLGKYFISAALSSKDLISGRKQLDNDSLDGLPNEDYENAVEGPQRRILFKPSSVGLEDILAKLEEDVLSEHDDKLEKLVNSPFSSFARQEVREREDESNDLNGDIDGEFDDKENVPPTP